MVRFALADLLNFRWYTLQFFVSPLGGARKTSTVGSAAAKGFKRVVLDLIDVGRLQ